MSELTMTQATEPIPSPKPLAATVRVVRTWKTPIILGVFTVLSIILFGINAREGISTFSLSTRADAIQLTPIEVDARLNGIVTIVILLLATAAVTASVIFQDRLSRRQVRWISVLAVLIFSIVFLVGFLAWAAAGSGRTIPVPGMLVGALALSVPLIFGALGGVISERVGVVNVAIEGQLLAGAFFSAVIATVTGSPVLGLISAMIAGMLVSFVLAAFSIKYFVDQVIVGVVLNVLVAGLTSFFYSTVLARDTESAQMFNTPERFAPINIPLLSEIPILGPMLFRQTIIVYIMYFAVFAVWFGLFRTKWGLRLRAVGEHPQAADTVGINVARQRFWNVALAGAIAGLGGAFFTLGSNGAFGKEMTAGAGFIALAAVIFGRWDPIRATLAALLFGFASNLQTTLSIIGSPVPSEFMLMLPYLVTIFAVAGVAGRVRGPAASGKPYVKA